MPEVAAEHEERRGVEAGEVEAGVVGVAEEVWEDAEFEVGPERLKGEACSAVQASAMVH